jgi:hypothetical protein
LAHEKKFIKVLFTILNSPYKKISEIELREVLGSPPKSTWYKQIKSLTTGVFPILKKIKSDNAERPYYELKGNMHDLTGLSLEESYIFESYKHLGSLLGANLTDIPFQTDEEVTKKDLNDLNRKFFYLSMIQAKPYKEDNKKDFKILINGLLNNKQLFIHYPSKEDPTASRMRSVRPLTICHHRDDLYLLGLEEKSNPALGITNWEKRTYKISRIDKLTESNQIFKYPTKAKWNPEEIYKCTSGLIRGEEITAKVRVYEYMRTLLKEKTFMNSKLISSHKGYDLYEFIYTSEAEFLGQMFVWADQVSIQSPQKLKDAFIEKAEKALDNHRGLKKVA